MSTTRPTTAITVLGAFVAGIRRQSIASNDRTAAMTTAARIRIIIQYNAEIGIISQEIGRLAKKSLPLPCEKDKIRFMKNKVTTFLLMVLLFCSCHKNKADENQHAEITAEMAYEGVNKYCHSEYDWSVAADNPSMMSVTMGEETETEYKVIFRSYTGSFVYFYVDKASGATRIVEHVPTLDVESEAGTIDLLDYLGKD